MKTLVMTVALAICLTSTAAHAQAPSISTELMDMSLTREACLDKAEGAMRQMGLRDISRKTYSVFGFEGQNHLVLRCLSDVGRLLLVAAGPTVPGIESLLDRALEAWRK